MSVNKFALNLQPDKQKENRHEPVVDPQMDSHRAKFGRQYRPGFRMDEVSVILCKDGIGKKHGQRCGRHQQYSTSRFARQKRAQSRWGAAVKWVFGHKFSYGHVTL